MRFAIFGKKRTTNKLDELLEKLFILFDLYHDQVCVDSRYMDYLKETLHVELSHIETFRDQDFTADIAISIGGDGTFLRTAAKVGNKNIPIIGINTGRLGFLADVLPHSLDTTMQQLHNRDYAIDHKDLLEIKTDKLPQGITPYALNDIAILKHDIASMISVETLVDGIHLTTYLADGLVVATPTGSTAYSLSVGGPVIAPNTGVIELTPVAPHSLTMRSIVISQESRIELSVNSRSHSFLVSIDGNSFSCPEGTPISICKAPFQINVIKLHDKNYFSTLREKMMWGIDSRQ